MQSARMIVPGEQREAQGKDEKVPLFLVPVVARQNAEK